MLAAPANMDFIQGAKRKTNWRAEWTMTTKHKEQEWFSTGRPALPLAARCRHGGAARIEGHFGLLAGWAFRVKIAFEISIRRRFRSTHLGQNGIHAL